MQKKPYSFPEREIKEFECSRCDIQFRTDYKDGEVKCPHCWNSETLLHLNPSDEESDESTIEHAQHNSLLGLHSSGGSLHVPAAIQAQRALGRRQKRS